ncbi:MAG: FtsH protease activity modulator HflK [Clostridiales bacterium]|nr:FtsH protease activity modulator HflK [Clostridiales bacterium]
MFDLIMTIVLIVLVVIGYGMQQGKRRPGQGGFGKGTFGQNPFGRQGNVHEASWKDVSEGGSDQAGGFGQDNAGAGQNKAGRRGFRPNIPAVNKDKTKKTALVILTVAILAVLGMNSYYNVAEQENAVVTMFGEVIRTDSAGLHFKLPLIQRVQIVDMTTQGTGIGYSVTKTGEETSTSDGTMITKDFNFINIDFYMEYRVSDPVAYLYNSRQPEQILKNIAQASIRSTVINYNVDDAITTAKSRIQSEVKEKIAEELDYQNIGLAVVNITVQDATPPTEEIVQAFKSVETAKQGKETALNNANKYRNEQVPAAKAEADRIIQNAEAAKSARIAEAEGQVSRFNAMYEQYIQNPLITKQRLFYETLEEVLPDAKVIITDGNTQEIYPIESFSSVINQKDGKEE